jgi:hypothetical protein
LPALSPPSVNQKRRAPRRRGVATEFDKAGRDSDTELAAAVHRVLAILTDLRSDAHAPELRERIELVQWLRHELADVEALLARADARRDPRSVPAPTSAAAAR